MQDSNLKLLDEIPGRISDIEVLNLLKTKNQFITYFKVVFFDSIPVTKNAKDRLKFNKRG